MEEKGTVFDEGPKADTYLGWSIFNTICCCTPIGIVALVLSLRTDTANMIGDATRANAHSRLAKKLNVAALLTGVIVLIICAVVYAILLQRI